MEIKFFVPGELGVKGSAKAWIYKDKNTGNPRASITNQGGDKAKKSAARISLFAKTAMGLRPPLESPVFVTACFFLPRPKSHYLRGNLRETAPIFAAKRPDIDKLLRNALDAMTSICYLDDSQIVIVLTTKMYTNKYDPIPGVRLSVEEAKHIITE